MNREHRRSKDLKNTYLWVNREGHYGERYEEILLCRHSIPGLLNFYEIEENDEKGLVYLLDHQSSYLETLAGGRMTCEHIACFIQSLVRLMGTVDEYLLDPSNLVVEMAYIFGAGSEWAYVYIPGYGEDFWRQMEKLSEEWLNYVDYSNEKAVLWAYTFYQKVHGENCSAEELMDILAMECLLPEPNAAVVQEEVGAWPAEAAGENVGRKWTHRLAEKIKKMIYGRRKNNPDICDGFYAHTGIGADTCPMLEGLSEALNPESEVKKTFVLIPAGETEMPVIRVENFPFLLGRNVDEADACLDCPKISRIHARLEGHIREVKVVDLSSANGTYRNDERLTPGKAYTLNTGDILKLADLEFICQWC